MKILFATSEIYPLIKTGGLADVSGALPKALAQLGVDVRVITPRYASLNIADANPTEKVGALTVLGQPIDVAQTCLPDSDVPVYLIDHPVFSARQGNPYMGPDGNPWHDNPERFALFCRAVVSLATNPLDDGWVPDVIHCNDWQTGLIPALLSESPSPKTVFTIHNLAYQGVYDRNTFERLGLPWSLWKPEALEYWGNMSFLKGGVVFSDFITTVSPTYAEEIQTPAFGYGLDGLLSHKKDRVRGILNGIGDDWNPETDPFIHKNYSLDSLQDKVVNKTELQAALGLPVDGTIPLVVHIGRLVEQKGIDLLIQAIKELGDRRVQFAILGTGEKRFENALQSIAHKRPEQVAVHIGYDERLAHRLEAAADAFAMPSRFEPCGLNQLYSLRYGALPIVHRVGGLADTVKHVHPNSIEDHTATGIVIDYLDINAIKWALDYFISIYENKDIFTEIQKQGMSENHDWIVSAQAYGDIYAEILKG
ncbi:starch synthase [Halothiobacillus diazotrophicus]|uniref:Glycogen synthase n=1 Tax=Halothiobacillus diazotrophicus TaxID=1860122 RepID=A0A191ZE83_9GAMM|nr:glycogen synthase GlgA [Halothiobacillus diazotrophicus]ANJ66177.1 starch synthase [Halothiobacillus diazotrophicus]